MAVQAGQAQQEITYQEIDCAAASIIDQLRTIFEPRIIDQRITLKDVREHLILLTEAQVFNPQEVFYISVGLTFYQL